MDSYPLITSISVTYKMIRNSLIIIIQGILRDNCVVKYRLIVSFNVSWPITRYYHNPELVTDTYQILTELLHSHKLRPKAAAFHTDMFLGKPMCYRKV